jgi:nucleotide-binding universal stress UspA family protein
MLNFRTILLPVDFPHPSLGVIHQAATLAHHFHSEIVMLHVVTVQSHAAGVPSTGLRLSRWDLLAEIIKEAQRHQDQSLGRKLDGLGIRRMLKKGDPAQIILQAA